MFNNKDLIFPAYQGNSLVNVPNSILSHFNIKTDKKIFPKKITQNIAGCSKLVLFTIDGFGYNLWEKEAIKLPFFKKISDKKFVNPITSVFPSTTAAAITTINTGLTPLEHGLLEWDLYFQELDLIYEALPNRMVQTKYHAFKNSINIDQKMLFAGISLSQRLKAGNVASFGFMPLAQKDGPYTNSISRDAELITYSSIDELMILLCQRLESTRGNAYFYVYIPTIDSTEHQFGKSSEETKKELSKLSDILDQEFAGKLTEKTKQDTGFLLTADHGQRDKHQNEVI